jgi:septal ring factor EnvC (AmiA/AmiB activator)
VADLNKQLQDSLQTPKPAEGRQETPKTLETIVQAFEGSNAEKSANIFFDSTKFLEGEATKKLRIDLQKAYEGNLKLERDKDDLELRIRNLQKTIKDQSKRIKQQQDQFEELSTDFSRLETDLVQHKIRLVDAEDRSNDFEYQLMRINQGVSI